MNDTIYKHVTNHVTGLFDQYPHDNLVYHNLDHTKTVVKRALEIAGHYQLGEKETLTVFVAAWFHDVGHLFVELSEHETKGAEMMKEFMRKETNDDDLIKSIEGCILATRLPAHPENQLQEIVCDADTYHFGTKEFKKTNKLIKKELTMRNYSAMLFEWEKNTIEMLEKHQFYTSYCQVLLADGKRKNIERLKNKLLEQTDNNSHNNLYTPGSGRNFQDTTKGSLLPRGIQTMLRLTSTNHLRLSEMADRKANILISVNAIIISVILTVFIKRASESTTTLIPGFVFLATALTTIVLAILSTRPKITKGSLNKEDVLNKKTNLLFFGNFYRSTLDEYEWAMSTLMKDNEYLYSVMVKDLHQLAIVLARKYKLIRIAYDVFMFGLILTVLVFVFVALYHQATTSATTITSASGSPL